MKSVELERWTSSHNREELHYFLRDGQRHGYQEGQYLFGYNPALIREETAIKIMALVNADLD